VDKVFRNLTFKALARVCKRMKDDPTWRPTLEETTVPLVDPQDLGEQAPAKRINYLLGKQGLDVKVMAYNQEVHTDIEARCVRCGAGDMWASGWDRTFHKDADHVLGNKSRCRLVLDMDEIYILVSMKRKCSNPECGHSQCDSDGEVLMMLPPDLSAKLPFRQEYNVRVLEVLERKEAGSWTDQCFDLTTGEIGEDGSFVFRDDMDEDDVVHDVMTEDERNRHILDYLAWDHEGGVGNDEGGGGNDEGGDEGGGGNEGVDEGSSKGKLNSKAETTRLRQGTTYIIGKKLAERIEYLVSIGSNWIQVRRTLEVSYARKFGEAAINYQSKKARQVARPTEEASGTRVNPAAGSEDFDTPDGTLYTCLMKYLLPLTGQFYSNRYLAAMGQFSRLVQESKLSSCTEKVWVSLGIDGNHELWRKANPGGISKVWLCCVDARTKELLAAEWVPSESAEHLVRLIKSLPDNYMVESVSLDFLGLGDTKVAAIRKAVRDRQGGADVPIYEDLFHPIRNLLEHIPKDKEWFPRFVEKVRTSYFWFWLSLAGSLAFL